MRTPDFFVNHTKRVIVRAEGDLYNNITATLRNLFIRFPEWSLQDEIEILNIGLVDHHMGIELIVDEKYELRDWHMYLSWFLNPQSHEYKNITLGDHTQRGPFGV